MNESVIALHFVGYLKHTNEIGHQKRGLRKMKKNEKQ